MGEIAAIEMIRQCLPDRKDIIDGRNDDCAVVRPGSKWPYDLLFTSDPVIEGVHFKAGTPPHAIGRKAIGRVLSDIAAMGGEPKWALINIAAPGSTKASLLKEIYKGAVTLANKYGMAIAGGDMANSSLLHINVFAAGYTPKGAAILRSGASHNELLYVTGSLGGSAIGKHLNFEPRVCEGIWLRKWATAMIDISDGLATDIRHLTNLSGTGAILNIDQLPVSKAAIKMKDGVSPVNHALRDGEDFELLFTIPIRKKNDFERAWQAEFDTPCTRIGLTTKQKGVIDCISANNKTSKLATSGYQHFKSRKTP